MTEVIILCTYFALNFFIAGYTYADDEKFEKRIRAIFGVILCSLFGSVFVAFYYLSLLFAPILRWINNEVQFQYRFFFTDYWDKILLDDNYSEEYRTKEEKLKRSEELVGNGSKQLKRHNRQIQNKYAA